MPDRIEIGYPAWVAESVEWNRTWAGDAERMRLAIRIARTNVDRGTGGPFGAAIFERESGRLVSVGMNLVVASSNSTLHAEMLAIQMAEARVRSYTLGAPTLPAHELVTSCEPCAMCLGATLWSGVTRLVCGATRDDARRIQFDEGPVFPQSYAYLRERGIDVVRGVQREEARAVLDWYREMGGTIYNARGSG